MAKLKEDDKYAVVGVGGHQYLVREGEEVLVDKMEGKEGEKVKFERVLLAREGEKVKVGQPVVAGVTVEGKIVRQEKGKKVRVATYKAKTGSRRVKGFRAKLTRVKVERIGVAEKKKVGAKRVTKK